MEKWYTYSEKYGWKQICSEEAKVDDISLKEFNDNDLFLPDGTVLPAYDNRPLDNRPVDTYITFHLYGFSWHEWKHQILWCHKSWYNKSLEERFYYESHIITKQQYQEISYLLDLGYKFSLNIETPEFELDGVKFDLTHLNDLANFIKVKLIPSELIDYTDKFDNLFFKYDLITDLWEKSSLEEYFSTKLEERNKFYSVSPSLVKSVILNVEGLSEDMENGTHVSLCGNKLTTIERTDKTFTFQQPFTLKDLPTYTYVTSVETIAIEDFLIEKRIVVCKENEDLNQYFINDFQVDKYLFNKINHPPTFTITKNKTLIWDTVEECHLTGDKYPISLFSDTDNPAIVKLDLATGKYQYQYYVLGIELTPAEWDIFQKCKSGIINTSDLTYSGLNIFVLITYDQNLKIYTKSLVKQNIKNGKPHGLQTINKQESYWYKGLPLKNQEQWEILTWFKTEDFTVNISSDDPSKSQNSIFDLIDNKDGIYLFKQINFEKLKEFHSLFPQNSKIMKDTENKKYKRIDAEYKRYIYTQNYFAAKLINSSNVADFIKGRESRNSSHDYLYFCPATCEQKTINEIDFTKPFWVFGNKCLENWQEGKLIRTQNFDQFHFDAFSDEDDIIRDKNYNILPDGIHWQFTLGKEEVDGRSKLIRTIIKNGKIHSENSAGRWIKYCKDEIPVLEDHFYLNGIEVNKKNWLENPTSEAPEVITTLFINNGKKIEKQHLYGLKDQIKKINLSLAKIIEEEKNSYIASHPEFVGTMPIRTEIMVLPADDPKNKPLGFIMKEKIGTGIYSKNTENPPIQMDKTKSSVWTQAGYRITSKQFGNKIISILVHKFPNLKEVLQTPFGQGLIFQILGWSLLGVNQQFKSEVLENISSEFRREGLAVIGENLIMEILEAMVAEPEVPLEVEPPETTEELVVLAENVETLLAVR